jgi:gamma-glutamylcyclotransferase (GGCT)/AIG2-like uncharacterized protein YtfP
VTAGARDLTRPGGAGRVGSVTTTPTTALSGSEPRGVFVYGTLLTGQGNHALIDDATGGEYGTWAATLTGPWALQGVGRSFPALAPSDTMRTVHGEYVTFDAARRLAVLAALDHLEGYRPGDPGSLYQREAVDVEVAAGAAPRLAWTYVWRNGRPWGGVIESGNWRDEHARQRAAGRSLTWAR